MKVTCSRPLVSDVGPEKACPLYVKLDGKEKNANAVSVFVPTY